MLNPSTHTQQWVEFDHILVKDRDKVILNIPHAILHLDQMTAVIGPNGAGKTTLLKLLHGLIAPDSGSLRFSDSALSKALVLHHTAMIKASARTNLALVRDTDSKISDADIEQALGRAGLKHLADTPAQKLSAGERQRLCLARALLQSPSLILLDEPTANLDPHATEQVETMMRQYQQDGLEVIFSSHQLAQVKRLAEQVIFIADGQIQEVAKTSEFFLNPKTPAAQRFLSQELVRT
ncbi:ATP-binding cassette domain-containing protein [Polynucleobacter paludilacus]|uniref:ATP-binding cassette domain-containing protein n=1 Tax=Polynucleobacter paludilacus TaxID=1855895 RepID=UPI001BFDD43D|nr:ATP-binding cassette domain-containing protein [Polynucleobacter paludilacus]QWD87590.1 ATP-binding cassette domain-containing protein [Polynucleobacter paludilacus]